MRINTNVASMVAQESSANVNKNLSASLEKLSSGLRINKAADDASGMAIADKLRTQASSLGQSISNANSANALVQIADKAMAEQSNILDIVKTKLIQASTDTTSTEGRAAINADINKLLTQFDAIASQTNYNGIKLLNAAQTITFQTGETSTDQISVTTAKASTTAALGGTGNPTTILAGATADISEGATATITAVTNADNISVNGYADFKLTTDGTNSGAITITSTTAFKVDGQSYAANETHTIAAGSLVSSSIQGTGIDIAFATAGNTAVLTPNSTLNVTSDNTATISVANSNLQALKDETDLTASEAQSYMAVIDAALNDVNTNRSAFGSSQNQLDSFIRNAMTTQTNIKAAESVIRDVDYAAESANFNKQNIIAQAGTYAMSQANAVQQNVMRLLQ